MKNKKYIYLATIFVIWLLFDRLTKIYFDSGEFFIGQKITDSFLGIFHFTLVHNTGGAFGLLGDATYFLAGFSILIAVLFIVLYVLNKDKVNILHTVSIALICAGGIGNAIDRLVNKYVTDFICFDFISFPVFNIADIGVTCGIILLIIALLKKERNHDN
ncbi:MAG: signal peptidase II [Coriobacteriia bacterium]|nr:signal peptidase II [Coriobacteriia bacterium]